MTQQNSFPERIVWKPTRGLALAAGLAALFVLVLAGVPYLTVSRVWNGFLARAAEADPFIEAVYLKYFESGKWPESVPALGREEMVVAPEGWQYYFIDRNEPPLLAIRGPLHMRLEYAFRKEGNLHSSGGWRASCEGDPVRHTFSERIPIRPDRKAKQPN